MATLVRIVGLSGALAQEPNVASIYNSMGGEVLSELSVEARESFTLTIGVETNFPINAVNISYFFDVSILQIAAGKLKELSRKTMFKL